MRRRLATLLSAAMLALAVLAPAAPALAAPDTIVMAAAGPASTEGPEPRDADNTENEFAPQQYEANFTALLFGRGLFALILGATIAIGLGYWIRVARFERAERQS